MSGIRWVASRKMAVLNRIDAGELSVEDAYAQFELSPEELAEWRARYERYGKLGLRTTRLQYYDASRKGRR